MAKLTFRYRPPPNLPGVSNDPGPRSEPPPAPAAPDEEPGLVRRAIDRWWHESSYELKHGLEVQEDACDTLPGPLLDELFRQDGKAR